MAQRLLFLAFASLAGSSLAACVTTLPVPEQILTEHYERARPMVRLPLRHAVGQPLRDARSYIANLRDNGQIYMLGKGRFVFNTETVFCIYESRIDPSILPNMRQYLRDIGYRLHDGIDEYVFDDIYRDRREDFVFRPENRTDDDDSRCNARQNVVHVRSNFWSGRVPGSHIVEMIITQDNVFYTFFFERNDNDPPIESILVVSYGAEGPMHDTIGADSGLLSLMAGYYTRQMAR